jgi:hypothetical protein
MFKKTAIVLLAAFALVSCSTQKKSQSSFTNSSSSSVRNIQPLSDQATADGSSYEKAVFIDKDDESSGVNAEYAWLKENYPGYKMISQSLEHHNGRSYDILKITTKDRAEKRIYFDISKFFGRF